MMDKSGNYIKLSRSILEWEWWSDINTYRVFTYMLLKANWKDTSYKGTTVPRGSFVSSLSSLSNDTNLTIDEVRTALKHLRSTGEITSTSHGKSTIFTVNNYDVYQDNPKHVTGEIPSDSHSIATLFPTKEEKKEGKNIKNIYRARGNHFNDFPQSEGYDIDKLEDQLISN